MELFCTRTTELESAGPGLMVRPRSRHVFSEQEEMT